MNEITKTDAPTLDALCDLLIDLVAAQRADLDHPGDTDLDTSSLPTYGGVEPADTQGIFSWDAERFLVQDGGTRGWKLVPRSRYEDQEALDGAFHRYPNETVDAEGNVISDPDDA